MIIKVKRAHKNEVAPQAISFAKTVRVVKASQETVEVEAKNVVPNVMKRVASQRPLTEAHARRALAELFGEGTGAKVAVNARQQFANLFAAEVN